MTNNIRVFLWLGLGLALWVNYSQWQLDYGAKATTPATTGTPDAPKAPHPWTILSRRRLSRPPRFAIPGCGGHGCLLRLSATARRERRVSRQSPRGHRRAGAGHRPQRRHAGIRRVAWLSHGQGSDRNRWCCSTRPTPRLTTCCSPASPAPSRTTRVRHTSRLSPVPRTNTTLAAGQDELRVPLTWTDGQGVTVTKSFVFHRSMFAIGLEQSVQNGSATAWMAASYARISRTDPRSRALDVQGRIFASRGPAIFDPNGKKYQRLDISKTPSNQNLLVQCARAAGSRACSITSSASLFRTPGKSYSYTLRVEGPPLLPRRCRPAIDVAPGATAVVQGKAFRRPEVAEAAGEHE